MSYVAPSARLGWRLLPAVAAAAVAVIAASLLIGTLRNNPIVVSEGEGGAVVAPDIADAAIWHTDAYPVGASGHLSKKESVAFKKQKERVRVNVRDLADAISLDPGRLPRAAQRIMTGPAAASLLKTAPPMPKGAEQISALKRTGRIGIQAPRFSAAAAEMSIVMQATVDGRIVRWRDSFTFWLQRAEGEWRVISYELDRVELR